MVATNGTHHNNQHVNGKVTHLPCSSDHEPASTIDTTPFKPTPKWRDEFPRLTHNLAWQDGDGYSHSLTLRSDSITDLLSDLKLLKSYDPSSQGTTQQRQSYAA